MKRPSRSRLFTLSAVSIGICAIMYGTTGFSGKNTPGLDIGNLFFITSVENPGKIPAKFFHFGGLLMSLSLCITGPLVLFPARTAIRKMFALEKETPLSYHLINVVISLSSIIIGILRLDISLVTGFIGSLCGSTLVFLLPALTLYKIGQKKGLKLSVTERMFILVNICIGTVCFLGCFPWTGYQIYSMAKKAKGKP